MASKAKAAAFAAKVQKIKEASGWSEEDIQPVLIELNEDEERTMNAILDGTVKAFQAVPKKVKPQDSKTSRGSVRGVERGGRGGSRGRGGSERASPRLGSDVAAPAGSDGIRSSGRGRGRGGRGDAGFARQRGADVNGHARKEGASADWTVDSGWASPATSSATPEVDWAASQPSAASEWEPLPDTSGSSGSWGDSAGAWPSPPPAEPTPSRDSNKTPVQPASTAKVISQWGKPHDWSQQQGLPSLVEPPVPLPVAAKAPSSSAREPAAAVQQRATATASAKEPSQPQAPISTPSAGPAAAPVTSSAAVVPPAAPAQSSAVLPSHKPPTPPSVASAPSVQYQAPSQPQQQQSLPPAASSVAKGVWVPKSSSPAPPAHTAFQAPSAQQQQQQQFSSQQLPVSQPQPVSAPVATAPAPTSRLPAALPQPQAQAPRQVQAVQAPQPQAAPSKPYTPPPATQPPPPAAAAPVTLPAAFANASAAALPAMFGNFGISSAAAVPVPAAKKQLPPPIAAPTSAVAQPTLPPPVPPPPVPTTPEEAAWLANFQSGNQFGQTLSQTPSSSSAASQQQSHASQQQQQQQQPVAAPPIAVGAARSNSKPVAAQSAAAVSGQQQQQQQQQHNATQDVRRDPRFEQQQQQQLQHLQAAHAMSAQQQFPQHYPGQALTPHELADVADVTGAQAGFTMPTAAAFNAYGIAATSPYSQTFGYDQPMDARMMYEFQQYQHPQQQQPSPVDSAKFPAARQQSFGRDSKPSSTANAAAIESSVNAGTQQGGAMAATQQHPMYYAPPGPYYYPQFAAGQFNRPQFHQYYGGYAAPSYSNFRGNAQYGAPHQAYPDDMQADYSKQHGSQYGGHGPQQQPFYIADGPRQHDAVGVAATGSAAAGSGADMGAYKNQGYREGSSYYGAHSGYPPSGGFGDYSVGYSPQMYGSQQRYQGHTQH
eukprot:TRINITY_DN1684_c0_g1_i1.p1 TRINITY_DN1684_c0_g1~~TRINITY_DN1684_c0_g1_i1.p1  ORF type:complete len:938 (+),score=266.69 TRINITY_DN1684_c0_g1_i1:106-2919(+)